MSYVRFGWDGSDVYVFDSCSGRIECCGCRFGNAFNCGVPEEMIAHLATHRRAGHFVPEYAITNLWNSIEGQTKPRKPQSRVLEESQIFLEQVALKMKAEHEKLKEKKPRKKRAGLE